MSITKEKYDKIIIKDFLEEMKYLKNKIKICRNQRKQAIVHKYTVKLSLQE